MLNRLRLLLAIFALSLLLPCAAVAEDEPTPKDEPKKEEPSKADPKNADPKKDEPAKDGEKKSDDPKSEEDDGDEPSGEDGDPEKGDEPTKGEDPAKGGETKKDDAQGGSVGRVLTDEEKAGMADAPTAPPAGMAYLRGGRVMRGTEQDVLGGLLAGRPPSHRKLFNYETPYHAVFLRPYFISKHEVTNAQYHRFLQDAVSQYDTASGSLANLDEIAAHLVRLSKDQQKNPKQIVWLQLYMTNKAILWKAFESRLDELQVKRKDGAVDEYATARKFRFESLPRNLKLQFYSLQPPSNWPNSAPPPGEEDHPVRFVSYNDAERFAEWAGMHLPTEAEWEWAARGPHGPTFPWGNQWPPNALYANWGGKITDSRYEPTTLPVASRDGSNPNGELKDTPLDGDGRSWCGCHHMVGNVAEWTSSWFEPYRFNERTHNFMGRWVKVIRGGGAGDGEMLVLRAATRNYIGGGPDAPPYPENAFQWVGFRLAAYMKSGRDQLGPVIRRAVDANKMKESMLAEDRFLGAVTRNWVEPTATPDNHVHVRGRANSIVIVPQKSFLFETGMDEMQKAWRRPSSYKSGRGIAKKSETEEPFYTLGVLHTDVPIEPVLVRKPAEVDTGKKKGKRKKKRRGRGRAKAPETIKGKCDPGTYLLAVWFGRLTILTPSKEFVAFLPKDKTQKITLDVVKSDDGAPPADKLLVDSDLDEADFSFSVPLGGKGIDERLYVVASGRLRFELGGLDAAGTWIQEDPAAELTAQLRAEYDAAEAEDAAARKKNKGRRAKSGKAATPKKGKAATPKKSAPDKDDGKKASDNK